MKMTLGYRPNYPLVLGLLLSGISPITGLEIQYDGMACQGMNFLFDCPRGYFISVTSGFYGRQNSDDCLLDGEDPTVYDTTCSLPNAKDIISQKCRNLDFCELPATNETFPDPCPGTHKYMTVTFICREPYYTGLQCEGKKISLECPEAFFINPHMSVVYGRQDDITCSSDVTILDSNCTSDTAMDTIVALCGVRRRCDVYVEESLLGDPCPGTYKYLEVGFSCSACRNEHENEAECDQWAEEGECSKNFDWMMGSCRESCLGCDWKESCINRHIDLECDYWASIGECSKNVDYMSENCTRSCNLCTEPVVTTTTTTMAPTTTTTTFTPDGSMNRSVACKGNILDLTCPSGTYLRIDAATFGRTDNTTCTEGRTSGTNETNCRDSGDTVVKIRTTCSGREVCLLGARLDAYDDGCPGTYKYLEVYYRCQECVNEEGDDDICEYWAGRGECSINRNWMWNNCFKACSGCGYSECGNNPTEDENCDYWATRDECDLNPNWMENNCRESCRKCPSEDYTCDSSCNGHGLCIGENVCDCDSGYSGRYCSTYRCDAVNDCGEHGTCIAPNQCRCEGGWSGVECSETVCGGVSECSGNGWCVGPDDCLCFPYWSGNDCAQCTGNSTSGPSCIPCPDCMHGSCQQTGATLSNAFRGCYLDDLSFETKENSDTVNTLSCIETCRSGGYRFAGTTYARYCACGFNISNLEISLNCDLECTGGVSGEICGGSNAMNVWQVYDGECVCDGPNWSGDLCDTCNDGFAGSSCLPISTESATTSAITGTTELDVTTSVGTTPVTIVSSSTPTPATPAPTPATPEPTPATSETPATPAPTSSIRETPVTPSTTSTTPETPTTTPGTSASTGAVTIVYESTTSATISDTSSSQPVTMTLGRTSATQTSPTGSSNSPIERQPSPVLTLTTPAVLDNGTPMIIVVEKTWKSIYNDTDSLERRHMVGWLEHNLLVFYGRVLEPIEIVGVVVTGLRKGSIIVDHVVLADRNMTLAYKRDIQCRIVQELSKNNGNIGIDLQGSADPELSRHCAITGEFCKNDGVLNFDEYGYWTCSCLDQFTGSRCENTVTDSILVIVMVTVCLLAPLVAVMVICCVIPRRCEIRSPPSLTEDFRARTTRSFEFHSMQRGMSRARRTSNKKLLFGSANSSYVDDTEDDEYMPRKI